MPALTVFSSLQAVASALATLQPSVDAAEREHIHVINTCEGEEERDHIHALMQATRDHYNAASTLHERTRG